jgi:hypothetical protein
MCAHRQAGMHARTQAGNAQADTSTHAGRQADVSVCRTADRRDRWTGGAGTRGAHACLTLDGDGVPRAMLAGRTVFPVGRLAGWRCILLSSGHAGGASNAHADGRRLAGAA